MPGKPNFPKSFFRSIAVVIGLLSAAALADEAEPGWPLDAKDYRFHMIGNAHIDPVWLWPWTEGLSVVHSTFRSVLDRMNETLGFHFTASSAQFFDWVERVDPKMLGEIRARVKEGRWAIVGGWWVEPDVNMPSGESLARHGLYSQALFKRQFGRIATIGYNPDSFGHPWTLPQILKLQGMDAYVMMRPKDHEKALPARLFWWEGPDGTRILTYRIPSEYTDWSPQINGHLKTIVSRFKDDNKDLMAFYGVGDHGGGPTKTAIASIENLARDPAAPAVLLSDPYRYFAEVRPRLAKIQPPVVRDDLQHHSVGCYTSESSIKKGNRMAEAALVTAETYASVASATFGSSYPKDSFTEAWKRVLFEQFHDSLSGTALPEHYRSARAAHGHALDVAEQAAALATQKITWGIPTDDPESEYLVVFNPHPWKVNAEVEYELAGQKRALPSNTTWVLTDANGSPVPVQWVPSHTVSQARRRVAFRAEVPPLGYQQFRLQPQPPSRTATIPDVRADGDGLENAHLKVGLGADGLSILDKDTGKPVLRSPFRALVIDDPADTWAHDVRAFDKEIGSFEPVEVSPIESGPVRGRVRVKSTYGQSTLTIDWILYAGATDLLAEVNLDWHERGKMLKLSFPVAVERPKATYEISFGSIERGTHGDEDPGQRWIDVSGAERGEGLSVINDAKYGYSVSGSDLRISVVRGAAYAHHDPRELADAPEAFFQDQGQQTFRMLLVPHLGTWKQAGIPRLADELTAPVHTVYQGIHPGSSALASSFLSFDAPNVAMSAFKKAEIGEDWILRFYETSGEATFVKVSLDFLHRQWAGSLKPFEIKTLRIPSKGGTIREVNLLEEKI